ncbi:MAG: energy transducer TonB [Proteobacteria bacterium]|nr:energy transducer TonB [Pseudomonadota bacterium]
MSAEYIDSVTGTRECSALVGRQSRSPGTFRTTRRLPATLVTLCVHAIILVVLWRTNVVPWHPSMEADPVIAVLVQHSDTAAPTNIPPPPELPPPEIEPVTLELPVVSGPPSVIKASPAATLPARASAEPASGPVALRSELAVACPERSAPRYPVEAKRRREQGTVSLGVELDESGRVADVTVIGSSGSHALDDAAVAAVRGWRCNAAERDGRPVRAFATQALDFVIERR